MYSRIFALAAVKPVPAIVIDTVSFTIPLVGEMLVTVAAVALETVNVAVSEPPSLFRTVRVQGPVALPERGKSRVRDVVVSAVVVVEPTIEVSPDFVRDTVAPLMKPEPAITTVCDPPFVALEGDNVEMEGETTAVVTTALVPVVPSPSVAVK